MSGSLDQAEGPDTAARRVAAAQEAAVSVLSLAGLDLEELPEGLMNLAHLTELDLSGNRLVELPEWLGGLTSLEVLVLRGNHLVQLPSSLAGLTRLTRLDAAENRLLQVATVLAALPNLEEIELDGNPHLLVPPPETVAQGAHAALAYLRRSGGATRRTAVNVTTLQRPPRTEEARRALRKRLAIGVPTVAICAGVVVATVAGGRPATAGTALNAARAVVSEGPSGGTGSPNQATPAPTRSADSSPKSSPSSAKSQSVPRVETVRQTTTIVATPPSASVAESTASYPTAPPGVDLASGRPATASSTMEKYVASNATDGSSDTYWESQDSDSLPQELTVDLGAVTTVGGFDFHLPQESDWNERTETFTILGSTDGTHFFTIRSSTNYTFNANSSSHDSVSISVGPVHTRYVRLHFTATAGWPAAQMGELDVYS